MRDELREKAIARYRAALTSPTLTDGVRALIHAKLAFAYTDRTAGTRGENLESAIEHFEKSLEYEKDDAERARTHLNLSVALRQRIVGDRSDNIERSLEHGRRALELRNETETPLEWSDALRTLGESYLARLAGDARENVQRAIDCFERALTAATYEADPERWANGQMGLAAGHMAHPDITRTRVIESATRCRLAQRVFTRATHPERWESCEQILGAVLDVDPFVRAVKSLATHLKERTVKDDPFGAIPDRLLEFIRDPANLPKGETPPEVIGEFLEMFASKIRDTVAERLGHQKMGSAAFLPIHVVEDWDINAQVATQPPYNVYVSTNLVRFCTAMSELLTYGLGMSLQDDGAQMDTHVSPAIPVDVIANHIRVLMDTFLRGEEILRVPTDPGPAHYTFAVVTLFSTMTFLVSHEFGHVVFNEYKRRGEAPPFLGYAEAMLEAAFEGLIEGRHHAFDTRGLEGREELDLAEVFRNWAEEITSDIIGASLALEFQSQKGPWAAVSDILPQTKLGIHLALVSQLMINLYCNLARGDHRLMSPTHPPMDFRTFCVLKWLYGEDFEAAEKPVADYVQSIMTKVVSALQTASP